MQKLKVGDTVQVMAGAERAKNGRGKVISFDWDKNRLKVEGLRIVKRHVRRGADSANPDGGRIEKPGSIAIASVSLVCPACSKPTRVGVRVAGEKNERFCKKCKATIK